MIEIFRFITEPLDSNCYVIKDSGSNNAVVIDPGHPRASALKFVEENGLNVEYILLTHRHFDHILGAAEFARKTGAKLAIHKADAVGLESAEHSLFDMFEDYYDIAQELVNADVLLSEGDVIEWAGGRFEVMHTPGHSAGSVCYKIEDSIFTGDTLFERSIGRIDFPTGNEQEMIASLNRLKNISGDYKVYSGHGEPTTLDKERRNNIYMK